MIRLQLLYNYCKTLTIFFFKLTIESIFLRVGPTYSIVDFFLKKKNC